VLLELPPQLLPVAGGIELGTARNADLGEDSACQVIAAGHIGDLLPDGDALGVALAD